jgi:hypothetical protein
MHVWFGATVGGCPGAPNTEVPECRICEHLVWNAIHEGDKKSPKNCSRLKSCESLYTCPRAPFYREAKGLLYFENTLESKEYY